MALNVYDGRSDNFSASVQLTATPQTASVAVTIPAGTLFRTPNFEVRAVAPGAVDVLASAASENLLPS